VNRFVPLIRSDSLFISLNSTVEQLFFKVWFAFYSRHSVDTKQRMGGLSTCNELIPARNASLAAMQGFARGSNVRYYPT
jgi:hypothetical protein